MLNSSTLAVNTIGNLVFNGVPISLTSVGENPPLLPSTGTTWFDTNLGQLFIYYDGGWVDTGVGGGGGGGSTNLTSVNSNIIPRVSSVYNIGTFTSVWNNLHINRVFFGTSTLTVNSTSNILLFNGTPVQGQSGPQGPIGPQGPVGGALISVTATDTANWLIDTEPDPTVTLIRGFTYYFNVNAPGYNFWIKSSPVLGVGSPFPGVTNNGTSTGLVTFYVPRNAPNTIYYTDQNYATMAGTFVCVDYQERGPQGVTGPTGPTGPGANQALDTTSSVRFKNLIVDGSAIFNSTVTYVANENTVYTDALVELHSPSSGDIQFNVINNGNTEWILDGQSNPTITLVRNRSYTFSVVAIGHPFFIKTSPVGGGASLFETGVTNNGTDAGNVVFDVPTSAPATLYYVCANHPAQMFGVFNIVDEGDPSVSWTFNDGNDIGFRFHYYDAGDKNAALLMSNPNKTLDWFVSSVTNLTTGTFTGTFGKIRTGSIELKSTSSVITFSNGQTQNIPFQGVADFATSSSFASTATTASGAINVIGGDVQGNVVNGTTSTTQVGYLVVPQIDIANTFSYTLTLNDQGKHIYSITTASQVVVIPPNVFVPFPTGTAVTVVLYGQGTVSINTGVGVTLVLAGTEETGDRVLLQNGMATLLKVATNTWFINGTGIN